MFFKEILTRRLYNALELLEMFGAIDAKSPAEPLLTSNSSNGIMFELWWHYDLSFELVHINTSAQHIHVMEFTHLNAVR